MSSRLSVILLSGCWLLLCGCGFHPMYGDDALGKDSPLRGNISLDATGGGHEGQLLRAGLEDRFNPESVSTAGAQYHLSISLGKQINPAVIKSDGTIQRYEVVFTSTFKLFKTGTPAPILQGTLKRNGSYNAAANADFATYEAEQDVISRVLEEMAEDYVMRITGYLAARTDKPAAPEKPAAPGTPLPLDRLVIPDKPAP